MGNFKYNPGDRLGPNNILMLERTVKRGNVWFGKFLCPFHEETDPHYFECNISSVAQGRTKSCGCQRFIHSKENGRKRIKDLTGQRFGHLTVIKESNQRNGGNHILWECQCDCSNKNITYVRTNDLLNHRIISCGCAAYSSGEIQIEEILNKKNIKYFSQYIFKECKNINPLPFDFYLPDYNCCIEYDGKQHFKPIKTWGGEERFKVQQKRDSIKNQYCQNNGLYLIRIPYIDHDILNEEYIMERLNNLEKYDYNKQK